MTDDEEFEELMDKLIAESIPVPINPQNVPEKFRVLVPMAERWGVSEDGLQWNMLNRASDRELEALVTTVKPYHGLLNEWLAGPEADGPHISNEYIAFTCMRSAGDIAALILKRRRRPSTEVKQQYLPGFEEQ